MADITEKLERLFSLLEAGALTREQFEEQRDILLAQARRDSQPPPGPAGTAPVADLQTRLPGSGRAAPAAAASGHPESIGAYKILGFIGQGGMGAVYKAHHRNNTIAARQGGDVAIKVMHAQYARDERFQARFEQEAGLGLKLDHSGIVKTHDLIVDGGTLALVMEFVEGRSLTTMIGRKVGPLSWERAWPMFDQLLFAVGYAHAKGVIHRDLKPENVIVEASGRLKILDFGIAKEAGATGATATGVGMGTVDYMAPEQHTDAKSVDERADVYSLGMILYEMLAGRLPWNEGLDAVGVLHWKLEGGTALLRTPPPTLPSGLQGTLARGLAANPAERTSSVDGFRGELCARPQDRRVPTGPESVPVTGESRRGQSSFDERRRRWATAFAIGAPLVGAVLGAFLGSL